MSFGKQEFESTAQSQFGSALSVQPSGNFSERLEVTTGIVVAIDHFLLTNQRFIVGETAHQRSQDRGPKQTNSPAPQGIPQPVYDGLNFFFGTFFRLERGSYRVLRSASLGAIIIVPAAFLAGGESVPGASRSDDANPGENSTRVVELIDSARAGQGDQLGSVTLETRAVALVDSALLVDPLQLKEYRRLWQLQGPKSARDWLRERGASVRYGFSYGSEVLQIASFDEPRAVVLFKHG